jgi:hypothetical protein
LDNKIKREQTLDVGKFSRLEYSPELYSIMAHQPLAGRAGCGGGGRGGGGGRFPKTKEPSSLPRKGGEVGACKDLKENVFTIGSGNKGKDGDM